LTALLRSLAAIRARLRQPCGGELFDALLIEGESLAAQLAAGRLLSHCWFVYQFLNQPPKLGRSGMAGHDLVIADARTS
jgi:hypothetical protein